MVPAGEDDGGLFGKRTRCSADGETTFLTARLTTRLTAFRFLKNTGPISVRAGVLL
jgi:hypothetical protein